MELYATDKSSAVFAKNVFVFVQCIDIKAMVYK